MAARIEPLPLTVQAIGQMNFEGNIIPHAWYKTLLFPNGKPHLAAIIILADFVYWHRPTEIRDEITGQLIGYKKKFKADKLQRSYAQLVGTFGLGKDQARNACDYLEDKKLIIREFRHSKAASNVMYVDLVADNIRAITYGGDVGFETDMVSVLKRGDVGFETDTYTENTTENTTKDDSLTFYNDELAGQGLLIDSALARFVEAYRSNISLTYGSVVAEQLKDLSARFPFEWFEWAIGQLPDKIPTSNKLSYITTCLDNRTKQGGNHGGNHSARNGRTAKSRNGKAGGPEQEQGQAKLSAKRQRIRDNGGLLPTLQTAHTAD
jgi:hypothetical protein